jgi:hypothetical protein
MLAGEVSCCVSLAAGAVQDLYIRDPITGWPSNGLAAGQGIVQAYGRDLHTVFMPKVPSYAVRWISREYCCVYRSR